MYVGEQFIADVLIFNIKALGMEVFSLLEMEVTYITKKLTTSIIQRRRREGKSANKKDKFTHI